MEKKRKLNDAQQMYNENKINLWHSSNGFQSNNQMIRKLDAIAMNVYQFVLAQKENVSPRSVLCGMLSQVGAYSVEELGVGICDIPCLQTLFAIDMKVNAFIHCHVASNNITTLHDLLLGLCHDEGVRNFEDLRLGPAVCHPLIQGYFYTTPATKVLKLTTSEVIQHLEHYLSKNKQIRTVDPHSFLASLAKARGLSNTNELCIRVQSFGMYIAFIQQAKKRQGEAVDRWEAVEKFLASTRTGKTKKNGIPANGNAPKHIRFLDSDNEDDDDSKNVNHFSLCPYPSAAEERKRATASRPEVENGLSVKELEVFAQTWKDTCFKCSVSEVLKQMIESKYHPNKQKSKFKLIESYPWFHLFHLGILSIRGRHWENNKLVIKYLPEIDQETANDSRPVCTASELRSAVVAHFQEYMSNKENATGRESVWLKNLRWALECEKQVVSSFSSSSFATLGYKDFSHFLELNSDLFPEKQFATNANRFSQQRIINFVRQAYTALADEGTTSCGIVAERCCKQFHLSNIEEAGLGSIEEIIQKSKDFSDSGSLFFSAAMMANSKVGDTGRLGPVTAADAQKCFANAPLLCDLSRWAQWDAVFEPQLGPLVDWADNHANSSGILVMMLGTGGLVRIDGEGSAQKFLSAVVGGKPVEVASQLVSLIALHGGVIRAPKELLNSHARKGLQILTGAQEISQLACGRKCFSAKLGGSHLSPNDDTVAVFVLESLANIPTEFQVFAAEVLFSALSSLIPNASETLLRACRCIEHHLLLHFIGLHMGISEWIDDHSFHRTDIIEQTSSNSGHAPVDIILPSKKSEVFVNISEATNGGDGCGEKTKSRNALPTSMLQEMKTNANHVIESIRRDEFGLEQSTASTLLTKQHDRMGRALQCLSQNLYSEDCHFILEMIQNADDNMYKQETAALAFIVQKDRIVVLNNEEGFKEHNMRALCDIGNSTKLGSSAGYIGHKGIGFKSVFRITSSPEIHSNGFHVKFDITETMLGFILPTIINPPLDNAYFEKVVPNAMATCMLNTRIDLPIKTSILEGNGLSRVSSLFFDIQPKLLLFLHKLRTLVLKDEVSQSNRIMIRTDLKDNLVKVADGEMTETYLVVQLQLPTSVSRPGIKFTEVALAFGLKEAVNGFYESHAIQQPLFAFLPVRSYGLRFIVQGDFILPSSREEVDKDSAWNQWLRSEIPRVFLLALETFKTSSVFGSRSSAISSYLKFVPLDGEVLGFFSSLPRMIIAQLQAAACLPVEGCSDWSFPCMALRGWDDAVRELLPDSMMKEHLGMVYLDREAILSDFLASSLGVPEYGFKTLVDAMKSICNKPGSLQLLGASWVRLWLKALQSCMLSDEGFRRKQEVDFIKELRSLDFIPLSNGLFTSIDLGPVWFLSSSTDREHHLGSFSEVFSDLRIVHPVLLSGEFTSEDENISLILTKIGVSRVSAHDIIKTHILPMLSKADCLQNSELLVAQYLAYCMLHLQFDICNACEVDKVSIMSSLRENAIILTDKGLRRLSEGPIHFSKEMGSVVDASILREAGSVWNEVANTYLHVLPAHIKNPSGCWRKFLAELGVTDFVQVVASTVRITDKSATLWKDEKWEGDGVGEWIIEDWTSQEMLNIMTASEGQKFGILLSTLDKLWDENYFQFSESKYRRASKEEKPTVSSFVLSMRQFAWINSSLDKQLHFPKDLFHRCYAVEQMLGSFAPYCTVQMKSIHFVNLIGLRTHVTIEDVICILQNLNKGSVVTSLAQMERLYTFLMDNMSAHNDEVVSLFQSHSCVFVPLVSVKSREEDVSGRFYSLKKVIWKDPSGCLKKLEKSSKKLPQRSLDQFYPKLHSFFVDSCNVPESPNFDDYVGLLMRLARKFAPSDVLDKVLNIFTTWSKEIDANEVEKDELMRRKQVLKERNACILPTTKNAWIELNSDNILCWCDDANLAEQFNDLSGVVHFLDIGDTLKCRKKIAVTSFLQALGIPPFSEVVDREVFACGTVNHRQLDPLIHWVIPYAQRYLKQFQRETYESLVESNISERLKDLHCMVVDQVFYRYAIQTAQTLSIQRIQCDCVLQGNKLYVSSSHSNDYASIYLELSRLFFADKTNISLANFLHLITLLAQNASSESCIEDLIRNSQSLLPLPHDEVPWTVEGCEEGECFDDELIEEDTTAPAQQSSVNTEKFLARLRNSMHCVDAASAGNNQQSLCTVDMTVGSQQNRRISGGAFDKETLFNNHGSDQQLEMTGRDGEKFAFEHLYGKYGCRVKWMNAIVETGAPYDIIIERDDGRSDYVEVKSTRSSKKDWFEISAREWEFASEMGDNFSIIRVFLSDTPRTARILTLTNPVKLSQDRQLQLALIIPPSNY